MKSVSNWAQKIKKACEEVGTYRQSFDDVIDTLASILDERDKAMQIYATEFQSQPVYEGRKCPALQVIDEMNKTALAYWRDLGLTPSGLKKINDDAIKPKPKGNALEEALSKL